MYVHINTPNFLDKKKIIPLSFVVVGQHTKGLLQTIYLIKEFAHQQQRKKL